MFQNCIYLREEQYRYIVVNKNSRDRGMHVSQDRASKESNGGNDNKARPDGEDGGQLEVIPTHAREAKEVLQHTGPREGNERRK